MASTQLIHYAPDEAQQIAEDFLINKNIAGLFIGCGLGKTATCLSLISQMLLDGTSRGFLVIAPLKVVNLTWELEASIFHDFKWLKVENLRTKKGMDALKKGESHIYLINYDSFQKVIDNYLFNKRIKNWAFDSVIFDELTCLKNHKSKRSKIIRPYTNKLKRRWGLTGTPNPNSYLELFSQIKALDKGERLGKLYGKYKERFFHSIDYHERDWRPNEGAEETIQRKIEDICISLKTEDYSDYPPIEEVDYEISLPSDVKPLYKELQKELILLFEQEDEEDKVVVAANAAVLHGKLLQITSGALYAYDEDNKKTKEVIPLHDEKFKAILDIKKKEKCPVIIFTNFIHEEETLAKRLPGRIARFSKTRNIEQEKKIRDDWNAGKIDFLLTHPKSTAHGLNLQKGGHCVIWPTPNPSGELYNQGNHRIARKGQTKTPKVYRILAKDTVDWATVDSLHHKGCGQQGLLNALRKFLKK